VILTRTPLRVSLFGGGTDFPEYIDKAFFGKALSFAIDKYVYITLHKRNDKKIKLVYSKTECVDNASNLEHDLVRETFCHKYINLAGGVEIHSVADISSHGSGLGSSSAFLVGLLNAINEYKGYGQNQELMAKMACQIEIDMAKKPIGIQDQYACAYGGVNTLTFYKNFEARRKHLIENYNTVSLLESNIFIYNTGLTRKSETILHEQSSSISKNVEYLNSMRDMVEEGEYYLSRHHIKQLGELLNKSWELKKKLASNVSNLEIDSMVQDTLDFGACGVKIAGAGGGGHLICIVENSNRKAFIQKMSEKGYQKLDFKLDREGTKVLYSD
jgi:D-glycero-alpha-D-manno-heptose-7-phosphate kinase